MTNNRNHLFLLILTLTISQRVKKFFIAKCTIRSSYILSNTFVTWWLKVNGFQFQILLTQMSILQNYISNIHINSHLKISIQKNSFKVTRAIIDLSLYLQLVSLFTNSETVTYEGRGIVRVLQSLTVKPTTQLCHLLCLYFSKDWPSIIHPAHFIFIFRNWYFS